MENQNNNELDELRRVHEDLAHERKLKRIMITVISVLISVILLIIAASFGLKVYGEYQDKLKVQQEEQLAKEEEQAKEEAAQKEKEEEQRKQDELRTSSIEKLNECSEIMEKAYKAGDIDDETYISAKATLGSEISFLEQCSYYELKQCQSDIEEMYQTIKATEEIMY